MLLLIFKSLFSIDLNIDKIGEIPVPPATKASLALAFGI